MRRALVFAIVAVTLVLTFGTGVAVADESPTSDSPVIDAEACEPNVTTEAVGCWNGIHHSDDPAELGIDQSPDGDGLSEADLENMTYLKMARVEAIRERPFESSVPVEVITREEFAEQGVGSDPGDEFHRWNDQVWKALFVIGEDESSEAVIDEVFSGAVAGFYSPSDERIAIVVDADDELRVSPTTLLHELGHAMQDQYENLSDPRYSGATQDADLGIDGIVEGEVVYMEEVYAERCEDEWTCTTEPSGGDATGGEADDSEPNLGVLLTVLQPYSDGAPYVDEVLESEGWDGVDDLMADPPETTRETIHREPFDPTPIEFTDTAEAGWETYDDQGANGSDTVGEASLFVSMWYQSETYDAGVVEDGALFADDVHPYGMYNYAHPVTTGWANDELYPYRNDGNGEQRDGYVWVIEWETETDATEFHTAYRQVLDAHDATRRSDGVHYVSDGRFRGAYGVERNGTTLTIAHASEPEEVFELRPDIELDEPDVTDGDRFELPDVPEEPTDSDTPTGSTDSNDVSDDPAPGFGVLVAVAAIAAVAAAARGVARRREP